MNAQMNNALETRPTPINIIITWLINVLMIKKMVKNIVLIASNWKMVIETVTTT